MKSADEKIRTLALKVVLGGLAIATALAGCDTQLAGSSVGTGNPTEIQLGFKQDGSTTAISGRVDVYAATQVPVPGYSPLPLASIMVTDGKSATLTAKAMGDIKDSLWPKTSTEGDSIYRFNLVVSGSTQGAILTGFGYRKGKGGFSLRAGDAIPPAGEAVSVMAALTALVEVKCVIDPLSLNRDKNHYLFLYGTGYSTLGSSGAFSFPALPKGDYAAFLLSLPKGPVTASGEDSLLIYGTDTRIHSDAENILSVGSIYTSVPLPDSLKKK